MTEQMVTILLVDDDRVDVVAVRRSFAALQIPNPIVEAHNGFEALDLLRGQNGQARIADPRLVLLDLNMPQMGGLEFLQELRADTELAATVVFVLTTSDDDVDRARAYEQHVAGYVLKHQPGEDFLDSVAMLEHYARVVEFPV
jgi:CheY-like chemotaxis protein